MGSRSENEPALIDEDNSYDAADERILFIVLIFA